MYKSLRNAHEKLLNSTHSTEHSKWSEEWEFQFFMNDFWFIVHVKGVKAAAQHE